MNPTIGILLVDDHAIVRAGYRALLAKQQDMAVVGEASDGNQAYQRFKDCQPDVVITDLSLPSMSGLEVIARIKQRDAKAKILVFSMHQQPSFARQAIRAGALGYVSKSSQPEELLKAIHDVYAGRLSISADIAQALALAQLGGEQLALESLTVREFEILRLLVDAMPTGTIAKTLNISAKTVCNSHYLIKRKLGVTSDIELTWLAIRLNLAS
jgi:DNA-binding NarL/FixJ family response regulator